MRTLAVVGALFALLFGTAPAYADFLMFLDDNAGNTHLFQDNGTGDLDGRPGVMLVSTNVGVWSIVISTGLSKPQVGSTIEPQLDMSLIGVSSKAGHLTAMITDTDFGPLANGLTVDHTEAAGVAAGTVNVYGWIDTDNVEFGEGWEKPALLGLGPGPLDGTAEAALPDDILNDDAFSMTLVVDIFHGRAGNTALDAVNIVVPTPSTFALLASLLGVAGVVFSWRRRRNAGSDC